MRRLALLLLFAARAAHADVVTIDAANFATGTDITNSTPGVKLREITDYGTAIPYVYKPVYVVPNVSGDLGGGSNWIGRLNNSSAATAYFGNSEDADKCFRGVNCHTGTFHEFHALLMTFSVPTDLLEVSVHFNKIWIDGVKLRLYNAQKQLIATCIAYGASNVKPSYIPASLVSCGEVVSEYDCNGPVSGCRYEKRFRVTRATPDIAYAILAGDAWNTGLGYVSDMTFRRFSDCAL